MATGMFLLANIFIVSGNSFLQPDVVWLESPRTTPWGEFGSDELCPANSFVTGMRLKIDRKHYGDNTALNAVQLVCTNVNGNNENTIISASGRFGYYGEVKHCRDGFATGFQLRSQNGQGNAKDDVAAVDFELICTNTKGRLSHLHDNGNKFLSWGYWTQEQHCPSMMAVCGIATQVEDMGMNLKNEDETTLNNVDIACCSLLTPIETCKLKYSWETMSVCHRETEICDMSTGLVETEPLRKFKKFYDQFGNGRKFKTNVKRSLRVKAKNYDEKINNNSLERIILATEFNRKKMSFNVRCDGLIQQLVVTCDFIKLYVHETRCVPDQYDKEEWEGKGLYFRPTTSLETIFWSYNCDFTGRAIASQESEIYDCGDICLSVLECTHFVWNRYKGGTCWLKGSEAIRIPVEKYNEQVLCGWVQRT